MFWNQGDNYSGSGVGTWKNPPKKINSKEVYHLPYTSNPQRNTNTNIKSKCMVMQNYRLILKMIDEQGWILRNIIIWHKPNHMPSSVKDRFTNAYEPVFMLTKNKHYFFDLDAVRVPSLNKSIKRALREMSNPEKYTKMNGFTKKGKQQHTMRIECYKVNPLGKNPGDVWTIPTQPFPESHFATFPEKLVEPMIKAGCPKKGIVLDPFAGSGTTNLVAEKLERNSIGIELNSDYIEIIKKRFKPFT